MSQTVTIQCGERLSIERVESLYSEMEMAIREGHDIELAASHVQFCDTAGLQLILGLNRAMMTSGHLLSWNTPADVIYETSALLGLQDSLGLPQRAA